MNIIPLSRTLKSALVDWPRKDKRLAIMLVDLACLLLVMSALIIARSTLAPGFASPGHVTLYLIFALPFLSVAAFFYLGLYRLVTRHIGQKGLWRIGYSLAAAVILWAFFVFIGDMRGTLVELPRTVIASYWLFGWGAIWMNRQFARWWLRELPLELPKRADSLKKNIIIYGAGESGLQLLGILARSGLYNVAGFLDDDKSLWGLKLDGNKVYDISHFDQMIENKGICEVFIAIPSLSKLQRRKIIRKLEPYPVTVKILPSIEDLATGRIKVGDIRHIEIDDLLGRDPVPPIDGLMERNNKGKVVMVTGAGGSIGSEISRQVVLSSPDKLILLELSELALYNIESEITELMATRRRLAKEENATVTVPEIIPVLGSVGDADLLREMVRAHGIETVYHTAAYKHIPLLEKNPNPAIENNVFATVTLARVMQEQGVENMVLISSDKAVRPCNIKGASNRLQEMVLQAMAEDKDGKTIFSIVRFGNVLDSSGSVVPRFREQIKKGGPVTVTHHNIVRYFMSIREAAQLVIQAGAMAKGGEVYVLDMGEPVKIDDLARSMIRLSGKEIMDEDNPDGDIELKYIGLRPGDKMFEELLIEGNVIGSRHPYIMRLSEPSCLGMSELNAALDSLRRAMKAVDVDKLQGVLHDVVEGYGEESVLKSLKSQMKQPGKNDMKDHILH